MKRILSSLLCLLLLWVFALPIISHPGRTDANGGHWDHSTGEYHRHGEPDNPGNSNPTGNTTNQEWGNPNMSSNSSGSSSSGGSNSSVSSRSVSVEDIIALIILLPIALWILWCIGVFVVEFLKECICDKKKKQKTNVQTQNTRESVDHHPPQKPPSADKPTSKVIRIPPQKEQTPKASTQPQRPTHGSEDARIYPPSPVTQTTRNLPSQSETHPKQPSKAPQVHTFPPFVLDVNPSYIPSWQAEAYAASLNTTRIERAITEHFEFTEITVDNSTTPFRVNCILLSKTSNIYHTSLSQCSCQDNRIRHMVCKHMLALALKINAISVDVSMVKQKNQVRE